MSQITIFSNKWFPKICSGHTTCFLYKLLSYISIKFLSLSPIYTNRVRLPDFSFGASQWWSDLRQILICWSQDRRLHFRNLFGVFGWSLVRFSLKSHDKNVTLGCAENIIEFDIKICIKRLHKRSWKRQLYFIALVNLVKGNLKSGHLQLNRVHCLDIYKQPAYRIKYDFFSEFLIFLFCVRLLPLIIEFQTLFLHL